ncbi:MAG: YihY/virulence factor BrkB family protein [Candidatus Kapabacteria bacterium]|nr:YihY/virulence factor BrkB family protein [Candidatus Kapabacteria bacterium]
MLQQLKNKYSKLYRIYSHISALSDRIDEHNIYLLASGISFNILIYILPLLLVVIYLINSFFGFESISNTFNSLVWEILPPNKSNEKIVQVMLLELKNILSKSSYLGIYGLIALLWVSSALISAFRSSLNRIFDLESTKFFLIYRLKDILLTIFLTFFVLTYSYVIPLVSVMDSVVRTVFPDRIEWLFSNALLTFASFVSGFILYYFIFSYVPNKKIPRHSRLLATIICAVSLELSRNVFAWYITTIADYGKFYGTYAIIVSLAFWIYYSSLIMLVSAEIGKYYVDVKNAKVSKG